MADLPPGISPKRSPNAPLTRFGTNEADRPDRSSAKVGAVCALERDPSFFKLREIGIKARIDFSSLRHRVADDRAGLAGQVVA